MNKNETSLPLTILLGVLISLSALGTDLYAPALPVVAQAFAAPVSAVQATVTTYFLGLAGGQLLWGPLSDRYGRKPVLLAALALMLAATAAAALAGSVGAVAAARAAQGFGMAGGVVIGRSIVRDLHAHERAARLYARMMLVFSCVPIAAPLAGAALAAAGGWRTLFWTYAAIAGLLFIAVAAGLRESAADSPAAPAAAIARRFREILGDRRFFAPFLLFLGCQMALAISPFPHAAGTASSLIGAIGFSCGALVSMALGAAFDGTARPLASGAALAALGVFVCEKMVLRGKA